MKYFLLPIILLIYFELLGRSFFACIKKRPLEFSFVIGFTLTMAVTYCVGWPITAFNGNFYHLLILYATLFIASVIFVIKNLKKIEWNFNWKWWALFIVLFLIQFYMSWTRTLGEIHGYDTLYYFNMISFNIENLELNSLHPHFGTYPNTDIQWITYVFQSYYYIVAVYIYVANSAFTYIGSAFEFVPGYYWTFQLICNAFFISTGLICIKEIGSKNKIINFALIVLLIPFMNNFYWNNAFGFIGNNFRMSIHALVTIYLFRYVKEKERINLFVALGLMLGMCGLSSTGTFALIFLVFGLFFYIYDKEKDVFKIFSIVLLVPLINIAVVKLGQHLYVVASVVTLCVVVYVLNNKLTAIYQNKYVRIGTIVFVFMALYVASIYMSGKVISLEYFFNNYSEIADMSWDYFYFPDLKHYLFNIFLIITASFYFFKNRNDILSAISFVLIFTFFNPLCSYFMNTINWVYYRCYDIIINQFTISLFTINLINQLNGKILKYLVSSLAALMSIYLAVVQMNCYWHLTFIPDEDYNPVYKMENSELELIYNVRSLIKEKGIENPRIINSTFLMPCMIKGEYLYGKEKRYNWDKYTDTSYKLYEIFFPLDGADNFQPVDYPDYYNMNNYLDCCDYDILIVNNGKYFYDENNNYISLSSRIDESFQKTEYSTKDYSVYFIGE